MLFIVSLDTCFVVLFVLIVLVRCVCFGEQPIATKGGLRVRVAIVIVIILTILIVVIVIVIVKVIVIVILI